MPSAEPGSVSALPLAERGPEGPLVGRRAGLAVAHRLGQAPVDHERLAVLAHDHVARLDVAVEHAPAVGVVDRVADVEEPAQELAAARATAGPDRP